MIINNIKLKNFRQFFGEQIIEFSNSAERNVTVLIGVNTSGKTTLIKAFEWCLYGKIGFEDPILLNNEVKNEMKEREYEEVLVAIEFIQDNTKYELSRKCRYICTETIINDGNKVNIVKKIGEDVVNLSYLSRDGQTKLITEMHEIKNSINGILPQELSDYFFFGGERISTIANRKDLTEAVRTVMGLDVLQNASTHLKTAIKDFQSSIDTKGDKMAEDLQNIIITNEEKVKLLEVKCNDAKANRDRFDELEKKFSLELQESGIDEIKKIKLERDKATANLKSKEENLKKNKGSLVTNFSKNSFAFFGLNAIKKSIETLNKISEETQVIESIPSMEQNAIDYLLQRGYCLCGTSLEPGTMAHEKAIHERRVLPPEFIGNLVKDFLKTSNIYIQNSETFKDNIELNINNYSLTRKEIGDLKDKIDELSKSIKDESTVRNIEQRRKEADVKKIEYDEEYISISKEIATLEKEIKDSRDHLEKYAQTSKKNVLINTKIKIASEIQKELEDIYFEREKKVKNELEERVNQNFTSMYHGNRKIYIDDKYRVLYSDVTNEESDGLKAVKSFAFISSLVSMARDKIFKNNENDQLIKKDLLYPLVMDAPFSNVDEIHIENISKLLPKSANQIVMAVMEKDWNYSSKILNKYVGKKYEIKKWKNEDGNEMETMSKIIKTED